jgi:hypothetical protein
MKKSLFILLIFTLVSGAYAQKIKFIQGISLSRYSVQPTRYYDSWWGIDANYKPKHMRGLIIGAGIEFALSENISLEIEELYFQKGSNVALEDPSFPDTSRWFYRLAVMSFPVLFKIKPLSGPSIYILGGGEFSVILSHKEEDTELTENTRAFDFGVILGYGFEIKTLKKPLFIEMRYHLGLADIAGENLRFNSIKTNGFAFVLGFDI